MDRYTNGSLILDEYFIEIAKKIGKHLILILIDTKSLP